MVGRGAVPVPLAPGDVDDVTVADGDDDPAAGMDAAFPLGHIQGLAIEWLCQAVRAPGAKCTDPMLIGEGP